MTTTYTYNGDGDRIAQTIDDGVPPDVTTTYILDTATPLTMVLSETTDGVTTRYWHGLDTLAQSDGTTTQYFAYDGLGSVRQLVDDSGSGGLAQTFDPYGNGYAKMGSGASSLGYSGEQTDSNGFVFLRARYYNPSMGRFFQRDMWKGNNRRPQSLNGYMYTQGNPVLHTDTSGLCPDGTEGRNCRTKVYILEAMYGFTLYWPNRKDEIAYRNGRLASTSTIISLSSDSKYNQCYNNEYLKAKIYTYLRPWSEWHVEQLKASLELMEDVLGDRRAVRKLTEGGVLFRADLDWIGRPGRYFPGSASGVKTYDFYFRNFKYAIALQGSSLKLPMETPFSDPSSGYNRDKQWTIVHEFGHRLNRFLESELGAGDIDGDMHDYFSANGAPTEYAMSNSREYFADTFASYVWLHTTIGFDPTISDGARDLRTIRNEDKPTESLDDYFRDQIVSKLH